MKTTETAQFGKELHETNRYQDAAFPEGMYIVTREKIVPDGRGYLDSHWHEEIQITLVTNGSLSIQVNGEDYVLEQDDVCGGQCVQAICGDRENKLAAECGRHGRRSVRRDARLCIPATTGELFRIPCLVQFRKSAVFPVGI